MASVPEATPQERLLRYNDGAVALHWLTALLVVAQVTVGFTFAGMERGPARGDLFTVHKSIGATILILALVRLAWRLLHPPPPFPTELPRWERVASVWAHRAFYLLLILLPLTGLMAVSGGAEADGRTSTPLLGGIPLPLIPGISEDAGERLGGAHELLVFITLAILVLHVAAALKHQIQRHRAAGRMPPFRTPGEHPLPSP
ncbi:cytochrome b [Sphingopyxis panaciterrulae]|uniref:Cytochrome b561 n=1 Tax=Sphingopyxis panaciterrulae TaxID=462372 RepID=A0A7W9B7V9_9SPHN|nr:cytochrome b/b6 domain-containing protein [Sphingopyxis panaciterrulae]MBB5707889.1 cytochrome b561 [Sphingopyxis panaciterrulae]